MEYQDKNNGLPDRIKGYLSDGIDLLKEKYEEHPVRNTAILTTGLGLLGSYAVEGTINPLKLLEAMENNFKNSIPLYTKENLMRGLKFFADMGSLSLICQGGTAVAYLNEMEKQTEL